MLETRLLSLLLVTLLLTGCSLFELRDAEDADDSANLCLPAFTPADVIHNFQQSFTLLNPSCYFGCFVDSTYEESYRYLPDTEFQDFPLFADWTAQSEYEFLTALQQYYSGDYAGMEHSLILTDAVLDEMGDSALYHADYHLEMFQGDSVKIYAGGIQLKLTRLGTFQDWAIYYWEDQAVRGTGSWTELKAWVLQ